MEPGVERCIARDTQKEKGELNAQKCPTLLPGSQKHPAARLLLSAPALLVARFFGHREVINAGRAIHKRLARSRSSLFAAHLCRAVQPTLAWAGRLHFVCMCRRNGFPYFPSALGRPLRHATLPGTHRLRHAISFTLPGQVRSTPSFDFSHLLNLIFFFLSTPNVAVFFSTCAILTP